MKFEELQNAWQAQERKPRVMIDADILLREVRRNSEHFDGIVFWRDVRGVGITTVFLPFLLYAGIVYHIWPALLGALVCLWIVGFVLLDRWRQRRTEPVSNDPLQACIEASLHKVRHQIALLKNVVWWYLCPQAIGLVGVLAWSSLEAAKLTQGAREDRRLIVAAMFVVIIAIAAAGGALGLWFAYRLNQAAARKHLEPRRQELEALLSSLNQ